MKMPMLVMSVDCEGDIIFPPEFEALSWIEKADLLRDWLEVMREKYNFVLDDFLSTAESSKQ